MIQRKQTLFLILAFIATILCLSMPIGSIEPKGMGLSPVLFNLGLSAQGAGFDFGYIPLFVLLIITCPIALFAIFLYKKRKVQAKLCVVNIIFNVLWYAYLAYCWKYKLPADDNFNLFWATVLPLISIILYAFARNGILHDERLVKAADRIR